MTEPFVTRANFPEKTREWKEKVKPYNLHFMKPDPEKTALLVIDMQRCFLEPGASAFTQGAPPIVPNVRELIETFRESGLPVIFSTHVHKDLKYDGGMMAEWWGSNIMEGTPEAEIYPELSPTSEEKVIVKHRYSAFYNTDLELTLRCLGTKDLIVTGVMTNLCCESTARDAFFRDFRVFFLLDATGAVTEAFHLSTLVNLAYGFAYVTDTKEILSHFR